MGPALIYMKRLLYHAEIPELAFGTLSDKHSLNKWRQKQQLIRRDARIVIRQETETHMISHNSGSDIAKHYGV